MPKTKEAETAADFEMPEENNGVAAERAIQPAYDDAGYEAILPDYEDIVEDAYEVSGGTVAKADLIGVPFAIYAFEFRQGKLLVDADDPTVLMQYVNGGIPLREDWTDSDGVMHSKGEIVTAGNRLEFVVVRAVTAPGRLRKPKTDDESEHVVFADGGTGIYHSLRDLFNKRGVVRIKCKRGLRVSEYQGRHGGDSTTWYLA